MQSGVFERGGKRKAWEGYLFFSSIYLAATCVPLSLCLLSSIWHVVGKIFTFLFLFYLSFWIGSARNSFFEGFCDRGHLCCFFPSTGAYSSFRLACCFFWVLFFSSLLSFDDAQRHMTYDRSIYVWDLLIQVSFSFFFLFISFRSTAGVLES